jgi:REP element-mobilizing transposase RayT
MPQSLSSILIHLIFSTKNREPFLTPEIDAEPYPYMASIFRAMKSPALIINGTSDHVHTLFSLSRIVTIADLVEEVKTESSKWIKTKGRVSKLSLAERVRSLLDWPIAGSKNQAIHPTTEGASS